MICETSIECFVDWLIRLEYFDAGVLTTCSRSVVAHIETPALLPDTAITASATGAQNKIAAGNASGCVVLSDLLHRSGASVHSGAVAGLLFSHDSSRLISVGSEDQVMTALEPCHDCI